MSRDDFAKLMGVLERIARAVESRPASSKRRGARARPNTIRIEPGIKVDEATRERARSALRRRGVL